MKTSDLIDVQLDWAVAKALGHEYGDKFIHLLDQWMPSTDWEQGGPILEREEIVVFTSGVGEHRCKARYPAGEFFFGETYLIAAMRCFVASRLGDEIEIPEELK